MIKLLKDLLKNWVAKDELRELEIRQQLSKDYDRWLAEFPLITYTLDNIERVVQDLKTKDTIDNLDRGRNRA